MLGHHIPLRKHHMRSIDDIISTNISDLALAELRLLIDKSDTTYYDNRPGISPIISDSQYDAAKKRLKVICPDDARHSRIGLVYEQQELRSKVKHPFPMGSLDNTDDGILGYESWVQKCASVIMEDSSNTPILASLKVDGSSIRASYKQGRLVMVATRGNGQVGDDITANGVNFYNLPISLNKDITCDVRGEAILPIANFRRLMEQEHNMPFDLIDPNSISNPRNVGNGILLRDSGEHTDNIHFYAFNIVADDIDFSSETVKLQYLEELGFTVVPHQLCANIGQFNEYYNQIVDKRNDLSFEIDGIVAVLDNILHHQKFASDTASNLRPKFARAIKFPHKANTTSITDVEITVGHTGAIVPTAILKTVRIGGVNVERVLLNNWDEIARLAVGIGDEVEVVLAGDIIPKVLRCVKKACSTTIPEPKKCPSCGSITTRSLRDKSGAITYCSAPTKCPAASVAKIKHWIGGSKTGVGILGIGDAIIKSLCDSNAIKDIADLYTLKLEDLSNLELEGGMRVGESRAKTILNNIKDKQNLPLHIFLGSLGIELLGRRRVQLLQQAAGGCLDSIDDWQDTDSFKKLIMPGLGQITRDAIIEGIEQHKDLIAKLLKNGVSIMGTPTTTSDSKHAGHTDDRPLQGFTCCWTGTRAYISDFEAKGGTVKSGISKGLHLLVQKDPTIISNKTAKAIDLGVKIISVETLLGLISGQVSTKDLGIAKN